MRGATERTRDLTQTVHVGRQCRPNAAEMALPTNKRFALKSTKMRCSLLLVGLLSGSLSNAALGQTSSLAASSVLRPYETRARLEGEAQAAETQGRKSEAWLLKSRLKTGDFQEGDRIVVALESSPRIDTLQVRAGKTIQFVGMGDLSLDGVLRSELEDVLRDHLAKYLKNPALRATPLLPISILGSVAMPGYYYTAADVVLRDVIMRAGGPRNADLNKVVVRRAGEVIWNASDVRVALADGLSLDRLHLRAGDEVFVPQEQSRFSPRSLLSAVYATTTIIILFTRLRH